MTERVEGGWDFTRSCAQCGDPLNGDALYPVITETDGEGETVLRSFCDDECTAVWGGD